MVISILNTDFRSISISIDGRPYFAVRKALCSIAVVGTKVVLRWGKVEDVNPKLNYRQVFDFTECDDPVSISNADLVAKVNVYLNNAAAMAADAALLNGQNGAFYLNRANHVGTQLASTISDFATAVLAAQLVFQKINLTSGAIDGVNTVFVWDQPPTQVFWQGQKLTRGALVNGYTLAGSTTTHTEAPETGDKLDAYGNY